jgi:hypothetical protein
MRWIQLVHAIPGRTRLRFPALRQESALVERAADQLAAIPGVLEVKVRPYTGSILITHDASVTNATVLDAAQRIVAADRVLATGEAPPESADAPKLSRIAQLAAHAFREIDRDVLRKTGGSFDLGTLATLGFFTAGALEVGAEGEIQMPPWFNLAWWGYRTFMTNELAEIAAAKD